MGINFLVFILQGCHC